MTYAHYYWNKDFIANTLCIKRSVPENKCQGKCLLQKNLKENKEQERQIPNPVKEDISSTVYLWSSEDFIPCHLVSTRKKERISSVNQFYSFTYLQAVFHPPQAA
jgi:hypothetical protein